MTHRREILRGYKQLLRLIERLPEEREPAKSYERARAEVRRFKHETDDERLIQLKRDLATRISFLRSITPRRPGERLHPLNQKFVARDGQVEEGVGDSKGQRVASSVLSWEDARKKHHQLLKRQYFGREPPKNPAGPL